ncbi:XRE family transcriptional regulator [Streptomyces sp. JJ66]|uniref:XRE family transcriptional regulator n=1 Tax=Streptomyces sp. JJ66 TaxID=2803843 RepID=UPI001C58F8BB|nr:XRE family transcriptional regulator [Streptomyces sp. JJ66]MBW1603451.1 XRE family transcriptional regulator [Streptomyces sp. JJ66]
MERDWARLGRAFADGRKLRHVKQDEVPDLIGSSRAVIQKIEQGTAYKRGPAAVHRRYADWLGWTNDSIDAVLAGGEPTMRDDARGETAQSASVPGAPDDLPIATQYALREGPLVETKTYSVPTAGGTLTATIVVRGEPEASPEEMHRALLEWRERARRLGHLDDRPE